MKADTAPRHKFMLENLTEGYRVTLTVEQAQCLALKLRGTPWGSEFPGTGMRFPDTFSDIEALSGYLCEHAWRVTRKMAVAACEDARTELRALARALDSISLRRRTTRSGGIAGRVSYMISTLQLIRVSALMGSAHFRHAQTMLAIPGHPRTIMDYIDMEHQDGTLHFMNGDGSTATMYTDIQWPLAHYFLGHIFPVFSDPKPMCIIAAYCHTKDFRKSLKLHPRDDSVFDEDDCDDEEEDEDYEEEDEDEEEDAGDNTDPDEDDAV